MIPLDALREGALYRLGIVSNSRKQFVDIEFVKLACNGRGNGIALVVLRLDNRLSWRFTSRQLFDIRRLGRKHA